MTIEKIFDKYKEHTGKFSLGYIPFYKDNFEEYRNEVKKFCEIGIARGQSLEIWRDYFPNAEIVGIDINSSAIKINNMDRIHIEIGDATNDEFLNDFFTKYGNFDIVLDDGSHKSNDMRKSFDRFWPHTKLIYCIEDLVTQYPNNCFPTGGRRGTPFHNQFIPDNLPFINDLKKLSYEVFSGRDDIFKLSFYKWQTYIHKNNENLSQQKQINVDMKKMEEYIDKLMKCPFVNDIFRISFYKGYIDIIAN